MFCLFYYYLSFFHADCGNLAYCQVWYWWDEGVESKVNFSVKVWKRQLRLSILLDGGIVYSLSHLLLHFSLVD